MHKTDLLDYLFETKPHALEASLSGWLSGSRRFAAFVETYQAKIRKKLRTTADLESLIDLQLELETAYLLLREKSFSLAYEPEHRAPGRSPDFAVDFTTSLTFMTEVTRLRKPIQADAPGKTDRFADLICDKLGQLSPQRGNLLVVGAEAPQMSAETLRLEAVRVQKRAEANDAAVLQRHGFPDRAAFFERFRRLSAILTRTTPQTADGSVAIWLNPQARFPFPSKVITALARCHSR